MYMTRKEKPRGDYRNFRLAICGRAWTSDGSYS